MDPIQTVIIFISLVLMVLFVALGVQVYQILKEMRYSLRKINKMLDDTGKMTGAVSNTVEGMSGLVSGLKAGLSLVAGFKKKAENDEHES